VPKDAYVVVETNRYPVPFEWVGSEVEVQVLAERVEMRAGTGEPVSYGRLAGKRQVAPWAGPARHLPKREAAYSGGPPRFDPVYAVQISEVEIRPLAQYAEVAG